MKFCGKLLEIKKKFEKGNLLLKKKLLRLKLIQKKIIYVCKQNNNKSNFGKLVSKISNDDF